MSAAFDVGQKVIVELGSMPVEGEIVESMDGILSIVVVIAVDSKGCVAGIRV